MKYYFVKSLRFTRIRSKFCTFSNFKFRLQKFISSVLRMLLRSAVRDSRKSRVTEASYLHQTKAMATPWWLYRQDASYSHAFRLELRLETSNAATYAAIRLQRTTGVADNRSSLRVMSRMTNVGSVLAIGIAAWPWQYRRDGPRQYDSRRMGPRSAVEESRRREKLSIAFDCIHQ